MKKETREKLYKIGEVAKILGIHEDTLRNWEREGFVVPERIGKRKDRRYTADMIGEIKKKGLVSDLAKKGQKTKKDLSEFTKDELIKELQLLNKQKKYGLVWENHIEEVVEHCKIEAPILVNKKEKQIKDRDKTKPTNILIEGDNYHALQVLNYTHEKKIDAIYIDPPYNTGAKDWKYNNDYVDGEDTYRHSKWLSFMSHRLEITKSLLSREGIICCTIDDYELPRLTILMEEIFGKENYLGTICIRNNPSGRSTLKGISVNHEYAIFFAKSSSSNVGRLPRNEKQIERYKKKDSKGYYEEVNFRKGGGLRKESPIMFYPIFISDKTWRIPKMYWDKEKKEWVLQENLKEKETIIYPIDDLGRDKRWKWGIDRVRAESDELFVRRINNKNHLFHKNRMAHETVLPNTWWDKKEYSATDHGTRLLKDIFGELKTFDYPKAVTAVKDCLRVLSSKKNAIFLDFFAGSGTTGQAVFELNREDGGNRKIILCTNNENKISEKVTYPRIKKVIKGYKDIKGIRGSLEYFKTEFVDIENIDKVSDKKKLEFTYEAGQMIALKEDTFKEVAKNKFYQIFTDEKDKFVGIYFRENLDKLSKMENNILDKKDVKLYLFSYGVNDFKKDYSDYKNVVVKDIPEPILKIYKSLNN